MHKRQWKYRAGGRRFLQYKEAYLLAQRQGVEMPITEQIYQILFCGKNAQDVVRSLLGRERKGE
ncbi:glycerol-3-phosphate dehydrogenase [NAD(P)+] [Rodentibacter pneumotropicus]|uniref:Glycerol-3-phosphate dehydrogenase [NAD(P)+] n=1 Tax=Rodentibacter pneumotropicus TaxID=758 RepID=A0A3S4U443_9PAST|nr:glycerol-3-phosphate dehydrogenase [NAD(P)+] [Rodentibacter pneumotropicus]